MNNDRCKIHHAEVTLALPCDVCALEARLAEAERVLRICANYPPAGMRPQDAKPFFAGFIPAEQRAARKYFSARATDSASGVQK
jgi:hypothetical protein